MPLNTPPNQDALPQAGGSYLRQPDGSLLRVDQPDTTEQVEQPAPTQE